MKFRSSFAIASLCFLALPFFAIPTAYAKSGNDLLADCTANRQNADGRVAYLLCAEYITGILDTWDYVGALSIALAFREDEDSFPDNVQFTPICVPDAVTRAQVIDILVKHLRDEPEERHEDAHKIVLTVMIENFSCVF